MNAHDMLEEDDANVIIDCDILEAAKENIQPLAGGRRVTTLASVLATPAASRDAKLIAMRTRMRERVREAREAVDHAMARESQSEVAEQDDESEDDEDELNVGEASELLLDTYVRFVTWTIEHYPKGQSAHSGILELLEEATRVLRHNAFAKQDARYLNLWVRYASYVEKPEMIYEFLLANDIGTDWGRLYEEYATVLEKNGRRTKADEMYVLGVSRRAEPLDHLERRHREFQKRMMVAAAAPEADLAIPQSSSGASQPSSTSEAPRRRVLGDATPASAPKPPQEDVFAGPSASRSTIASSVSSASQPRANGRMPVFVDPEGTAADPAARSAWPELDTRAERVKENVRTKEKMSGTTLKQKGAAKAATRSAAEKARAGPKIVPFRDAETSPDAPVKPKPATPGATKGKTKLVPFKDVEEPPLKKSISSKTSALKSKTVPFRDSTSKSASSTAKSKILPFKDPGAPSGSGSKSASKPAFAPFIDGEDDDDITDDAEVAAPKVPKAPLFIPFRDEDPGVPPSSQPPLSTAMRPKMLVEKDPGTSSKSGPKTGTSSEIEALKKDPFKYYAAGDL